jgi:hypothetical protein
VNDPDQTVNLPVVEFGSEPNGSSSPSAFPRKDTNTSHPTVAADAEASRFEPTVSGAIRRYRVMVVAVAILGMVVAIGYSVTQPKVYRTQAFITMPQQASLQGQQLNSGQYLDGQVLLLQSQAVAQHAAAIANAALNSRSLTASDFYGNGSSLVISPPATAAPGSYGATVIAVSFAAGSAQIADAGTNAVIQAYNQARSAAIQSQANVTIKGIDNALGATSYQLAGLGAASNPYAQSLQQQLLAQRTALVNQRAQTLVNEQIDLAQQPTVAVEPATTANHKWALDGGIGLVIGILIGCALAVMRAVMRAGRRRRTVADFQDPSPQRAAQPLAESNHVKATTVSSQLPPQG